MNQFCLILKIWMKDQQLEALEQALIPILTIKIITILLLYQVSTNQRRCLSTE